LGGPSIGNPLVEKSSAFEMLLTAATAIVAAATSLANRPLDQVDLGMMLPSVETTLLVDHI
jgi:hypothetical protein